MRILGMDYGTKRVGIAVSDEDMLIAFPLTTLNRQKQFIGDLKNILSEYGIETLVIGHPLDAGGKEGEMARKVRDEALRISNSLGVECVFWDERFTTSQIKTISKGAAGLKDKKDMLAATLILQSYLDHLRPPAERRDDKEEDSNHDSV